MARKKAGDSKIQVGNIREISGEVNIAAGDIHKGFTARQVSVLIKQISTTFQPKKFDGRCPYKGLDVFEEEDAELFFGREKLVDDLVSRVKVSRTVFITGPSGSGKSSLVRAGLIPALKQGGLKNSERWLYETMKPGRDPIAELGRVASSLASSTNAEDEIRAKALKDATIFARWCEIALKEGRDKRVVLFIDQFEEVFTQINKEEERLAFLNLLTHASTAENGRAIILFSMRSDFVSNCATYPELNALLNQQFMQIGAMQPEELVSAMAQPALRVGLRIDPDLIAQVINDMKGEPGALPLMQFTLKDLFDAQQAKGGMIALTLDDYLQHGGIQKSLERHADAAFAKLETNEQELARSIFSGLIEIGQGTQDTKRTALFDELVPANANAQDVETIVRKLADARLITTDESAGMDTVTISHEKLIDAWPWLKKLVNENRDVIALQNEIAEDAKEWDVHKRDASYLYAGARLINANEQLKSNKLVLSGTAIEYIRAGQARQHRGRFALIGSTSAIIALLLLAVIVFSNQSSENARQASENEQLAQQNAEIASTAQAASTLAVAQAEEAQKQANLALARQLAAQAQSASLAGNLDLGLLLSLETTKVSKEVNGSNALAVNTFWDLIAKSGGLALGFPTAPADLAVFSPDNQWLVTNCYDATQSCNDVIARLWNVVASNPAAMPIELRSKVDIAHVAQVAINQHWLVTVDNEGRALLWDLTAKDLYIAPLFDQPIIVNAISSDQRWLVTSSNDNVTRLWDLASSTIPIPIRLDDGTKSIGDADISPDNHWLVVGYSDGVTRLWDLDKMSTSATPIILQSDGSVIETVFINNEWVITFKSNSQAHLWKLINPTSKPINLPIRSDEIISISLEASWLVTSSQDNTARLWNLTATDSLAAPFLLRGHTAIVWIAAFSQNGHWLATGSPDGSVGLWDLTKTDPSTAPIFLPGGGGHINIATISRNSHWLFTVGGDGRDNNARLWDLTVDNPADAPLILDNYGSIEIAAISLDSRWLVTSGARLESPTRLWLLKRDDVIDDDKINFACQIAGRNLTRAEWELYFPNEEYSATCPQWPLEPEPTPTP